MKFSKILIVLLAFVLLFSSFVFIKINAQEISGGFFTDVLKKDYFYDAVRWAFNNNITTGVSNTLFAPNRPCTRGQIVTFLWRVAGEPNSNTVNYFTDVYEEDYCYNAVTWAVEKGITVGTSETEFSPNYPCTRAQCMTFLYRYCGCPENDGSSNQFNDVNIGDYYFNPVVWAIDNKITNGISESQFGSDLFCTRGQIVTLLYRMVKNMNKDERVFDDELPRVTTPASQTHFHFETDGFGFNVFSPTGKWEYRYAPSIMYYPDGTADAWFATPGAAGEWDWITYKHSDDGGVTWGDEKVVLQPTADSMDHYSICDPGVIYFGGYYYMGYTSTIVGSGVNNNVFVARSKNPDGPYEKWNGTGWGGDPQPIIYYNESDESWGAGEPSFVVVDDVLYIYYTWTCDTGDFKYVATADATNPNWPETIVKHGRAFTNPSGGDQFDVVYVEDEGLFLGVQTANRFTALSGIQLWESKDGIHFLKGEFIKKNISKYCHNMGISKRSNGHIQLKDNLMIGYAFSPGMTTDNWGVWATRFVFITLTTYRGSVRVEDSSAQNVYMNEYMADPPTNLVPEGITTNPHLVRLHKGDSSTITVSWVDQRITRHSITGNNIKKIVFSDYDESVISISGTTITGLKPGKTDVKATYAGFSVVFKVYVYDTNFNYSVSVPKITSAVPVESEVTIYRGISNGAEHKFQVRGYIEFANDTWGEAYNDFNSSHSDFKATVPAEYYPVTYTSSNESVATVDSKGLVTAVGIGDVVITATIGPDNNKYEVTIHVVAAPSALNWTENMYKW